MKKLLFFGFVSVLFVVYSCSKHTVTPVPVPSGTFSGQFIRIHVNGLTGVADTILVNTVLTVTNGQYIVVSDTTQYMAPSMGSLTPIDTRYITFTDNTAPANAKLVGTSTKVHLNGTYNYYYDGNNFNFYTYTTAGKDTVGYNYILSH